MADKKITELTNITGANLADADEFVVVDSSASETKAITWAELKSGLDTSTGFVRVTGDTMTGPLELPAGSVTAPSLRFGTGDLGFYKPATGEVAFTFAGVERFRIKDVSSGDGTLQVAQYSVGDTANNFPAYSFLEDVDSGLYLHGDGQVGIAVGAETALLASSTGVDVTGTVTADGLTVEGNLASPPVIQISNVGGSWVPNDEVGRLQFYTTDPSGIGAREVASIRVVNNATSTTTGGALHFYRSENNSNVIKAMEITHNGDISFYEDTGTTPKFFWDASAEVLTVDNRIKAGTTADGVSIGSASGKGEVLGIDTAGNGWNPLDIRAGSATQLYLNTNGNVGIGTSSPQSDLEIQSKTTGTDAVISLTAAGTRRYQIKALTSVGALAFVDESLASERMRIDSSGNVGIGTSSPSAELDVSGSGNTTIEITSGDSSTGNIFFGDSADTNAGYILYDHASNFMAFRTNGSGEDMRITSSGDVGIGEAAPQVRLDVRDSIVTSTSSIAADSILWLTNESSDANAVGRLTFRTVQTDAGRERAVLEAGLEGTSGGYLSFYTRPSGSAITEKMRITSAGSLLIAKTSSDIGTLGLEVDANGYTKITRQSATAGVNTVLLLNRLTTDGSILDLRKDGTTVGSIGAVGGDVFLGTGVAGLRFADANPSINPHNTSTNAVNDNAIDLGTSSARFKDLYLSGGVYLGGTGAANKLDDYEEGTWTPVPADAASAGNTGTSTSAEGVYTKVGNTVFVQFAIFNVGTTGLTAGNDFYLQGLPFTANNTSITSFAMGSCGLSGAVNYTGEVSLGVTDNTSSIRLVESVSGGNIDYVIVSEITSGGSDIYGSLVYRTP